MPGVGGSVFAVEGGDFYRVTVCHWEFEVGLSQSSKRWFFLACVGLSIYFSCVRRRECLWQPRLRK